MLILFYLIFFSICDETSKKICLYSSILPDQCKEILSFDISKTSDLDSLIEDSKSNRMILIFQPKDDKNKVINYRFQSSTFSKLTVNFTSLSKEGEKFHLDLVIDESTNSIVKFEDCILNFVGSSQDAIHFDWIEFERCEITLEKVSNTITIQAGAFDSSYIYFSQIIVEGGFRNPDLTIKTSENLRIELLELENIINGKVHVKYTNSNYRDIEIIGSQNLTFSLQTDKPSNISLKDINNLYFEKNNKQFPYDCIILCENIHNIYQGGFILPISLLPADENDYYFTNIYFDKSCNINGDINCNVSLLKLPALADYTDRIEVMIKGCLTSKLTSVNCSNIDLTITKLDIDMNKYIGHDPFIHCVGSSGVSSIVAYTDYAGYVGFNSPLFNRDFDTFLPDEEIIDFIGVEMNYLMIESSKDDFESFASPELTFANQSFIHGFTKDDSVIEIKRLTINPLVDAITISSPSMKPLKLCYKNDCKGGLKVDAEDLKDLSKKFVFKGMKNVLIESSSEINLIDFSKLHEDLNISVYSTSNTFVRINSLRFSNNLFMNFTFTKIELPSFTTDLANLALIGCSFKSTEDKIFTSGKTNAYIDSDFSESDIMSHFDAKSELGKLSLQIDHFTEIHLGETEFRLNGQKEYTISQTTVKWSSVEFKKDLAISDSLTLFAYTNNPPFSIKIESSKKSNEVFSVKLVDWDQIKESQTINLTHFLIPIQIVMTKPHYIQPIVLNGKGKVSYSHEYSSKQSICACKNKDETSSFPNCQNSEKIILFSELNQELSNSNFDYITVFIAGSSKDDHPTIELESINKKVVNFTSENSGDSIGFVRVNSNKQMKDPLLSETYFYNFEIDRTDGSEFVFGELNMISSTLVNFQQSTARINYFICDTNILNSLNEIYITDELIITGDFDVCEKTIHFVNDDNSEDLKAFILKNTKVILGNGKVTIGKINFLIEKSEDFDIVLNPAGNLNISFECEKDSKFDSIPPIKVNTCKNEVFDFTTNSENWPKTNENGDFLIDFADLSDCTLILKNEKTPITVESFSGTSKIIGCASSVGINGAISNSNSSPLMLSFEKTIKEACELKLYELSLSEDFTFSLLQPDLSLSLNTLSKSANSQSVSYETVKFNLYMGLDGFSSVRVNFIEENAKISPGLLVLMNIPDSIQLDSQELDTFCSKNYTIIKMPIDENPDFSLKFVDPKPKTHGMTVDAFGVDQDKNTFAVTFYTKLHPRYVPLTLCYNIRKVCEYTLTDDQLVDFSSLIPRGLKAVEVSVDDDISGDNKFINFDLPIFDGIQAEVNGLSNNQVNVHLGQNRIDTLTIDGVSVSENSKTSFKVKKLVVIGSLISEVEGFDEIEITDPSSWMMKTFDSFSGPIKVDSYESKVVFSSDGWSIGDELILYEKFPKLKIDFKPMDNTLTFESNSKQIHNLGIVSNQYITSYVVSKGWNNQNYITNEFTGLTIEGITAEDSFTVTTSSFPFFISPINSSQSDSQIIKFEKDIEVSKEKILLKNTNMNIDNSDSVTINELEFAENSVLNNKMPITVNKLTIKDGNFSKINQVTISEKLSIQGESAIEGQIDFIGETSEAEIEYLWDIDETPEVIFSEFPKNTAKVNVHFKGDSVSDDQIKTYNDFLYQKAFRLGNFGPYCRNFKERLHYISSFKYFSDEATIFESLCDDGELIIQGKRKIPDDDGGGDSGSSGKKKNLGLIISLSVVISLIVVAAIAVSVFYYLRHKSNENYSTINNSESVEASLGMNQGIYT